jgi:hypothetical protein
MLCCPQEHFHSFLPVFPSVHICSNISLKYCNYFHTFLVTGWFNILVPLRFYVRYFHLKINLLLLDYFQGQSQCHAHPVVEYYSKCRTSSQYICIWPTCFSLPFRIYYSQSLRLNCCVCWTAGMWCESVYSVM